MQPAVTAAARLQKRPSMHTHRPAHAAQSWPNYAMKSSNPGAWGCNNLHIPVMDAHERRTPRCCDCCAPHAVKTEAGSQSEWARKHGVSQAVCERTILLGRPSAAGPRMLAGLGLARYHAHIVGTTCRPREGTRMSETRDAFGPLLLRLQADMRAVQRQLAMLQAASGRVSSQRHLPTRDGIPGRA